MSTAGDPPDHDGDTEHTPSKDEPADAGRTPSKSDGEGLDVDARFAEIVAGWGEEPPKAWPTAEEAAETRRHYEDETDVPTPPGRAPGPEWGNDWDFPVKDPLIGQREVRDLGPLDEFDPDEMPEELRGAGPRDFSPTAEPEHRFEPPEPPPLPKGDLLSRLAWAAVIGGPLFLLISVLAWHSAAPQLYVLIALACFAGGFVTLVARMPKHRDDDGDDGAVV
ncbi:hypothetical protein [Kineosporia sp. NBRC 101731]|uniref:hypothetical protein n=1 Tax=Kineosporia sp. NBRC 101731 TaxID=3032199 RepID=UPI0024A0413F|nr:hypothetical protein [Kineosporia sp. NBRC 101731]GLY32865.1 hypothetical protein Kisp02_62300 [Kineosporia sp. NBRC 101731]